jgi:hypothetical protein
MFDQVKSVSIMDVTCLRSYEPNLFCLVNSYVGPTPRGTVG